MEDEVEISDDLILSLEDQSKIKLSDTARKEAVLDMEAFLMRVDSMKELNTDGVEPLYHIFPVTNVFREDEVTNTNRRERLLDNAPEQKDGHFKVPKTLE